MAKVNLIVGLLGCVLASSCSSIKKWVKAPTKEKNVYRVVWNKNLDVKHDTGNLPIALHSPVIYEGILFSGKNEGKMSAYELSNGRKIWSKVDGGGYHNTPIIFKDYLLYGTRQGRIFSRHYLSGALRYNIDLGSSIETEGVISKGKVFFHLRNHKIVCLDPGTGKILWSYQRSVPFKTTIQRASKPLIQGSNLYVGFADGYVVALNAEDGILKWEQRIVAGTKFADVDSTPHIDGERIVIGSTEGLLTILNKNNGSIHQKLDYSVSRAPKVHQNGILFGTNGGKVVLLNKSYEKIMESKDFGAPVTNIVSWKKYLVVTLAHQNVYFLNPQTLKVVETMGLGHGSSAVFGKVQNKEGVLAFLSSRNRLYVLR